MLLNFLNRTEALGISTYIRQIDVNIMDKFAEKLDMIKKKYVPLIKFSIKKLEFPNFGNFTFFYSFILFINK